MVPLRQYIFGNRSLAALLLAATLAMRLLVPAGFMPDVSGGSIRIELCPGYAVAPAAAAMPGMHHPGGEHHHGKAQSPCPYAALATPGLGSADPIQLAALIVYITAFAMLAVGAISLVRTQHLRPPLRAPPRPA